MKLNVLNRRGSLPPGRSTTQTGGRQFIVRSGVRTTFISLVAFLVLTVSLASNANALVIGAASSAFDLDVNLTFTQPPLPPVTIAFGPVNPVAATGPAGAASNSLLSFSLAPFVTVDALTATATTSFVPLVPGTGSASASASIGSLSLSVPLISTSFTSALIQSTADAFEAPLATGRFGTTTLAGASLTVLGINFGTLAVNPAFNTTLFSSGGVTVVLNEWLVPLPFPSQLTNAIDISFTNAPFNLFGGIVNGNIIVAQSMASLALGSLALPSVPEPASLVLVGIGLAGLAARRVLPALLGMRRENA